MNLKFSQVKTISIKGKIGRKDSELKRQFIYLLEQAQKLEILECCDCELDGLPKEVLNLTYLTDLNLKGNEIMTLPVELWSLTSLTKLNLRGNKLTTLPKEIGNLIHLTKLNLMDNHLMSLSKEIQNLTKLTRLNLYILMN